MKKIALLALLLVLVPVLYGSSAVDAKNTIVNAKDPDSRVNTAASNTPVVISGSRAFGDILQDIDLTAIGMPGDGYDNAGITTDGINVYLVSMYDNKVYVINPAGPSIVTSWNAPSGLSWGCGHEANMWISEYNTKNCYEYTWAGAATGNYFYSLQGGAVWMGDVAEWGTSGYIWVLAVGGSNKAYKFSIPGGTLVDSMGNATWTSISQRGLTYDPWNNKYFVGGWNSNTVWEINPDGSPTGRQFAFTNIASLAYDYQETPEPCLWLATNTATNHLYKIATANPIPADTVRWNFETGLQGWTHTNGYSFPNAWGVAPDHLHPGWACPVPQDSSLWFDDDSAGSGAPYLKDTALSPVIVPHTTTNWLKWGMTYQHLGATAKLEIGIKYFNGSIWTVVPLKTYTASVTSARDSADVSAYKTYPRLQVYAYYDDGNGWQWFGAIDNIMINGELYVAAHDVGPTSIVLPNIVPENTTLTPEVNVWNYGNNTETFDVTCTINPGGYSSTMTVTDLPPLTSQLVTFPTSFTFVSGIYTATAYTQLAGDINPVNDTIDKQVEATNWLYYDDGASANAWAWYDPDNGFGVQFPVGTNWWVDSIAVHIYDASWPSPGGTTTTLRLYDGASQPTNLRQELTAVTIVRGDWNKFAMDTTLTHYTSGDNVYFFNIQVGAYPNCCGLSIDGSGTSQPSYMWQLLSGAFSVYDYGGDWLLRIHVLGEAPGVGEWISVVPNSPTFRAPAISHGRTTVEFTLPTSTNATLVVYDASGRLAQMLLSSRLKAGTHNMSVDFNLPSGVYFYNLKTESGLDITSKFLLVR